MTTRTRTLCLLLSLGLCFSLACSSDDDNPTNVNIPDPEDPMLASVKGEGIILAQGLIDLFPALATGSFGGKDASDPVFDPSCTCWRWYDSDGGGSELPPYWSRNWEFAVAFYQGETPQAEFEGADRITVAILYNFYETDYDELNYSDRAMNLDLLFEATGFGTGVVVIDGSGSGYVSGGTSVGEEYVGYYEELVFGCTLTQPFTGCPTGQLDFDMDPVSFSIAFDGDASAFWTYQTGPGEPDTGTFTVSCGSR